MDDNEKDILADLLADWELAKTNRQDISVEQLCESQPQLLEPLRDAIRVLEETEWMTESSESIDESIEDRQQQISVEEVIRRISQFKLLPREESDSLVSSTSLSADQLTGELVQQGKLTLYQKKSLLGVNHFPLVIDRYTIIDFLGAGGMGIVFKAKHQEMNRLVAIKTVAAGLSDNQNRMERFVREIKSLAQLTHPHIVGAHDALSWNGQLYLVMEYADGLNLSALVRNQGKLDPENSISVVAQVANAIQFAHANGIIHRDIKPENIMVDANGNTKLLDLGLAKIASERNELTRVSGVVGTPNFVAPEMLDEEKEATPAADIYSLGCTLFFVLTGRPPFEKDSAIKTLLAHQRDPIPTLPHGLAHREALQKIVEKMMAKEPADRPTADQIQVDFANTGLIKSTINIHLEPQPTTSIQDPQSELRWHSANPARIENGSRALRLNSATKVVCVLAAAFLLMSLYFVFFRHESPQTTIESHDLKIAKWVLSYDECAVEIQTDVGLQTTNDIDHLPTSDFKITGIQLYAPTDPPDFVALAKLTDLTWISLSDFSQGEIGFANLARIRNLKQLYLENCYLDDEAIGEITQLSELRTLDLSFSNLDVKSLPDGGLSKLDSLKELLLADVNLDDDGLRKLKIPASVETLDLQENSISRAALPVLGKLTLLKNLALGGNNVGDELSELLPRFHALEDLQMARSKITSRFLDSLTAHNSIRKLHIYETMADDSWLDALVNLDQLVELDIADTRFSDDGILRLAEMKNLRSLTVGGLNRVSEATLDKLQDLMPNCEFFE